MLRNEAVLPPDLSGARRRGDGGQPRYRQGPDPSPGSGGGRRGRRGQEHGVNRAVAGLDLRDRSTTPCRTCGGEAGAT